jgi:hypothetical protein
VQAVLTHALPTAASARGTAPAYSIACATACCRLLRSIARTARGRRAIAAGGGLPLLLSLCSIGEEPQAAAAEAGEEQSSHELVYAALGALELACTEVPCTPPPHSLHGR